MVLLAGALWTVMVSRIAVNNRVAELEILLNALGGRLELKPTRVLKTNSSI